MKTKSSFGCIDILFMDKFYKIMEKVEGHDAMQKQKLVRLEKLIINKAMKKRC